MKRLYLLLLLSFFAIQIFASDLVLIPTRNLEQTKALFKNQALKVNFYKDEFVIATLDGGLKQEYTVLDADPWQNNLSYYLVYVDESVDKKAYYEKINDMADVLFDGGNHMILRIDENIYGQLPPAKNDGTVRISDKQAALPVKMFFNSAGRFDPDPFIVDLLAEVSGINITATVQHLQDYGTRNCYKPESIEAQNWIKEQFEAMGMTVELQDFSMPGGPASDNVIATLVGTKYPDEFIIMGGHYDSITYGGDEPGADDNASGTSGVMEIARILSQYEFDRTIIFCAFSGEEYGLYGSEAYADRCAAQGMNIHGYLNMDMIGYLEPGSYIHTDLIYPASAQELADFYTQVCATYLPDFPVEPGTLIGGDSDHTSFNNAGFMGIFPFEDGSAYSPYIHTSNDLIGPSYNNADQAIQFTKAILATAVSMANRVTPPQNLVGIPGDGIVDLQWGQVLDIDNYNIYRDNEFLTSTIDNFYLDTDVENSTEYQYYVTCIYTASGDESDPSNVVSVTPMPPLALPLLLDFENGAPYWEFEGTWGVSSQQAHSPIHSISESPTGEYGSNLENYATLSAFSLDGYDAASLSFWTKFSFETNYDYMWLEISTNGSNWTELDEYNGTVSNWIEKNYDLSQYLGEPYVVLRFHFKSDYSVTADGMYIDDFEIAVEGGMMTQNIQLNEGWTSISSYIQPLGTQIEDVLSSIENDIIIVQNMQEVWWPEQGINTIGTWDAHSGYKIKLSGNTSLEFAGETEATKTLNLSSGWNLMPVLSSNNVSCNALFADAMDDLIIIKEIAGSNVFWPNEDVFTLANLSATKAYAVKLESPVSVSFEGLSTQANKPTLNTVREGWDLVPPTGNSHVISIPSNLLNIFEIGDHVGVFTNEDACCGFIEINAFDNNLALVAFGNDSTTAEQSGMDTDEIFNFRMYRSSTNLEYTLIAGFDASMPNQQYYSNEGLSRLETLVFDNTGIVEQSSKISIYPNPASGQIHVKLENDSPAILRVFNINGQKVIETPVYKSTTINTGDLPKGVYTFRVTGTSFTEVEKVILK